MTASSAKPLVSLIMSTYSHAQHFPASLEGLLIQTYDPLEIIVLADGSNPESLELLNACDDPRLRYITTPEPSGWTPAWNRVGAEVKGKYLLYCAHDDILLPRAIDQQIYQMEAEDRVVFSHADFIYMDENAVDIGQWVSPNGTFIRAGPDAWQLYVIQTRCCMQTTVYRRDAWERVGGWDDDAGHPGDNSLYLKLLGVGDEGHVAQIACRYRVRKNNPDPPDKRFVYLQEHLALGLKHLAAPPKGLNVPVAEIRSRLLQHVAQVGLTIMHNAPTPVLKREIRDWLSRNVWPDSRWGKLWPFLSVVGGLPILNAGMSAYRRMRGLAASRVAKVLRSVRGRS